LLYFPLVFGAFSGALITGIRRSQMILAAVDANGFRCSNSCLEGGDYLIADCNGLVQGKSLFIHRVMQCNRSVNNFKNFLFKYLPCFIGADDSS
jgi:hypothetical protein